MEGEKAICHENCKPCEWYGVCPHSYAQFDADENAKADLWDNDPDWEE